MNAELNGGTERGSTIDREIETASAVLGAADRPRRPLRILPGGAQVEHSATAGLRSGGEGDGTQPGQEAANENLVARYRAGDTESLDLLLRSNEPLLHHVLKRFAHSAEPYEDLVQVARLGLLKAAQRFDAQRGTSFTTYAVAIVDGEVRHHLRDSLLLRQPRWALGLYQRIQETQADFFQKHDRPPTTSELAALINVREEGILEIIRVHGGLSLHSLDEPFEDSERSVVDKSLVRALRAENFALPVEDRILLYDALGALSDLQKKIVYLLFFGDLTQQEVADEMGLSQRAVSREQVKALGRLKSILTKRIF
ncbi:MAG: sigma-70 family RNA polymerase sigma factor [Thermoleophilia bacterium]